MSRVTPGHRKIPLRRPGACRRCGVALPVGSVAWYRKADKSVTCQSCAGKPEPMTPGEAGASAMAEYEKRRRNREQRTRAARPHLGGVILAFSEPPQSEEAWRIGAEGEQRLAAELARQLASTPAVLLHDRRIPGSRANIDHIVIATSGVYVIDAKRYSGRIERRADRGLFRQGREDLFIDGRNKTKLVEGVRKQANIRRRPRGSARRARAGASDPLLHRRPFPDAASTRRQRRSRSVAESHRATARSGRTDRPNSDHRSRRPHRRPPAPQPRRGTEQPRPRRITAAPNSAAPRAKMA